jgi:23S rRNA pseudouridine2605 synthase
LTAEQLQNARAAAWRQQGNALLTADDAAAWLREAGLALFLPRTAQIAAPAGSFVEATMGETNATPSTDAISNAVSLLHRLLLNADALALNLLGLPGDQPDFLATPEAFPFIYSLLGDKEWKRGPRGKSSPLVVEVWKVLDREGALSADEVKHALGRQLTESAALRALTELWTTLRIEPVYSTAEGTRWQLLQGNHEKAMTEGAAMGHSTALSAMVSLYLQASIAATNDEIAAFLSPLASRSRIREAVNGLHGTRQLGLRNLGAHEHFYVEGSLPEFAEIHPPAPILQSPEAKPHAAVETAREEKRSIAKALPDMIAELPEAPTRTRKPAVIKTSEVRADAVQKEEAPKEVVQAGAFQIEALSDEETERERTVGEGRKRFVAQRSAQNSDRKTFGNRPTSARPGSARPGSGFSKDRPAAGRSSSFGAKKPFFPREPWKEDSRPSVAGERKPFGDRKPFTPREGGERKPFTPREGGDRKPFAPRAGGDRKPFAPRGGGERKPFAPKEGGDRRPFTPREGGDRKPFTPREGGKPFSGADRKPFGARKTFPPREGQDRKPFAPRGESKPFGDRPAFAPRTGSDRPDRNERSDRKPFTPRSSEQPFSDRKPFFPRPSRPGGPGGDRKPFVPREGGRPFSGGDRKSFTPGAGAPGKSFHPRADGEAPRPFKPRSESGSAGGFASPRRTGKPGVAPKRFSPDAGRPARPGAPAGPASAGKRPRKALFTSTGQPRSGVGATGRPGPKFGPKAGQKAGPKAGFGPRAKAGPSGGMRFGSKPPAGRIGKPPSGRKPGAAPRKPGAKGPRRDA